MSEIASPLLTLVLLVASGAGGSDRALAQNNPGQPKAEAYQSGTAKTKKKSEASAKKQAKRGSFRGKLASVDTVNKTITIKGKDKDRTYQITSNTKLTKAGKPAVLGDAVAGEDVAGSWKDSADGKPEAVSVNFGAKAPAHSMAKKKETKVKEGK